MFTNKRQIYIQKTLRDVTKMLSQDFIVLFQVIFLLPCAFAIPLVYYAIENNDYHLYYTLGFGGGVFFLSLVLQIIGICLRKQAAINAISNLQLENETTEDYDEGIGRYIKVIFKLTMSPAQYVINTCAISRHIDCMFIGFYLVTV